ncbi:MAG: methyltransferase [bacterium]|nr:methyltransferase [bacterium]
MPFLIEEATAAVGGERLTICERDLRAVNTLRDTFPDGDIRHTYAIPAEAGDFLIMSVEKNRQALFHRLEQLAGQIGPTGRIFIYGSRKEGIKPAQSLLGDHCRLEILNNKGGYRIISATPGDNNDWELKTHPESYVAEARGQTVQIAAVPGLFSWDHLDDATAALLSACAVREGDKLLDLGCAGGAVAGVLLMEGKIASATLVDSDHLALTSARRTLELNNLNGEILPTDAAGDLPDRTWDLVLANPPFHQGFAGDGGTARRMIEETHRVLAAKGRIYLVGPVSLKLGKHLDEIFGEPELLVDDIRFQVWRARKKRRRRRPHDELR